MNHTLERIAKFFWLWDVLLKSLLECIDYPTYGATWLDPGGLKVFLDRSDGRKEVFFNDLFVSFVLPLQEIPHLINDIKRGLLVRMNFSPAVRAIDSRNPAYVLNFCTSETYLGGRYSDLHLSSSKSRAIKASIAGLLLSRDSGTTCFL